VAFGHTTQERETLNRLIPFFTVIRALAAAEWNQRQNQTEKVARPLNRAREELASAGVG
jgi:hypothetical protein